MAAIVSAVFFSLSNSNGAGVPDVAGEKEVFAGAIATCIGNID